jgi:hypothetical protein
VGVRINNAEKEARLTPKVDRRFDNLIETLSSKTYAERRFGVKLAAKVATSPSREKLCQVHRRK